MINKLIIFNFTAACGMIAAAYNGFLLDLFKDDYVTYGIVLVFLYGLAQIFWFASGMVKDNVLLRFQHVNDLCAYLTGLGILGTAIGVVYALKGANATDPKAFADTVLGGTKLAFHATIVGIVAYLWHHVNCRIVHTQLVINGKK